jgi:4-amino-4-deoxy-L-arabinose transferase-like glycosyltransferase
MSSVVTLLRRHGGIALILAGFLALATLYSVTTPIFESPDEIWHYPVIQHIATGHGLPIQEPGTGQLWQQEGSQPPLYYLLGAAATFWIDTSDLPQRLWNNPHAHIGIPLADGNKNVIVHTVAEDFPYRGTVLAVHLIRLLSVLLGAITVLLTYRLALAVFPGRVALAAGAAAVCAFIPQFLFISGSVNNDNLVTTLAALALWQVVRLLQGDNSPGHLLRLGIVIGLAALSKLSGLGLLVLAAASLVMVSWQRRSLRLLLQGGVLVIAPVVLLAGWWYARNWTLYGDPTGINVMLDVIGRRPQLASMRQLLAEAEGFKISFWALFGAVNVLAESWVYRVFDLLTILALLGLLLLWARWLQGWFSLARSRLAESRTTDKGLKTKDQKQLALLALWLGVVFASFVRWTQMTMASQGRLLFVALPAIAILFFTGLTAWVPRRYTGVVAALVGMLFFITAAIIPFRTIAPAYARPAVLASIDEATIPQRVHVTYGDQAELIGYALDREAVRPGEALRLTLYWRALARLDKDYSLYIHLFGWNGQRVGQRDSYPGGGAYPTRLWQPGDVLVDSYLVRIAPTATVPSRGLIEVGLYDRATMERLPVRDGAGRPIASPLIGRCKLAAIPATLSVPNAVDYRLGEQAALVGYEVNGGPVPAVLKPGDSLRLVLYWRALAKLDRDYTVFVHLEDQAQRIWGQKDGEPQAGNYPTSLWDAGEIVRDERDLIVAPDAPPGAYELAVGLYLVSTGERLPVTTAEGRPLGDRLVLGWVQVVAK